MNNNMKKIKYEKRLNRNIYNISDEKFRCIWCLSIALMLACLCETFIKNLPTAEYILIFLAITAVSFITGMIILKPDKSKLIPYKRKEKFHFLGLHNLSNDNLHDNSDDVIKRDEEVNYITNMLEDIIFPQSEIKQALCITGKSGCGKSTILAFFQQMHQNEYEIHNFSGNYNNLKAALENQFSSNNIDSEIRRITGTGKKVVFIFDQFERYFYLSKDKQLEIRYFIASLCHRNTAIITSMREEFLAEFLREFDLNDIKSNLCSNEEVHHNGLLRNLVGMIKDSDNYVVLHGSRRKITYSKWENEHVKSPYYLHITNPDNDNAVILDKIGITLFYCENQNSTDIRVGNHTTSSSKIASKCEECFGNTGMKLFSKFEFKPLIEQQIIFHMAESDKTLTPDTYSEKYFIDADEHQLLKKYFDTQLCSTGDYYNASRVMYILSSARLHQISMKTDEIAVGLFADQFSSKGKKKLLETIDELENLQLIRKNSINSTVEFEIAHDYIATAFLNYSRSNLDRYVKEALDIYLADFISENDRINNESIKNININTENRYYLKMKNNIDIHNADKFYKIATIIMCILIICIDLIYRFVWNPWDNITLNNPVKGFIPLYIPIHLMLSILYFYQICEKVLKYYNGKGSFAVKICYIIMGIPAVISEAAYPHFIITDGLAVVILGATACMLLGKEYRETSRAAVQAYGIKSVTMGSAFTFAHITFILFQSDFPQYLYVLETYMMALLIGYAHFSHLTREYLYGRRMDVSGEKVH